MDCFNFISSELSAAKLPLGAAAASRDSAAPSSLQPSSEEQLLLLGQEIASRPAGGGGGSRGRSVSFSLPFSAASPLPASPPRWQEHASEAGSPTLVQVLLMSRHSPGTPSPADAGYGRFNYERTARSSFLRQWHHPHHCQPPCHRPWLGWQWQMMSSYPDPGELVACRPCSLELIQSLQ